jgi:putative flippase GtrA
MMLDRLAALHARSGVRFVITGCTQLALDWGLFVVLTHLGMAVTVANPLARFCVVFFGFWMHGVYTFAGTGGRNLGWAQAARFVPAWIALTAIGTMALAAIEARWGLRVAWIAKPAIEAVLAVASYAVMRQWVFRKPR